MNPQRVIISGGEGDLALAIAARMRAAFFLVESPSRQEMDVTDSTQIEPYFAEVGDVDLLICNAGVILDSSLARMTESQWDEVMRVNLRGAFLCARAAAKSMVKRRHGHIIFIASFSALQPPAGQANYAAAKSALLGLMKSLAQELGVRNIRVNAVFPGFLETKMTQNLSADVKRASLSQHVLGVYNQPEEVAKFIQCLHQDLPYTSGQVFNLDSRILP